MCGYPWEQKIGSVLLVDWGRLEQEVEGPGMVERKDGNMHGERQLES